MTGRVDLRTFAIRLALGCLPLPSCAVLLAASCGSNEATSDAGTAGESIPSDGSYGARESGAGGVTGPDGGAPSESDGSPQEDVADAATGATCTKWLAANADAGATSQWVYVDSDGGLAYKATSHGDRIMDFSQAGYMGGGVALPTVPAQKTVSPAGLSPDGGAMDDTSAIQAAIDAVAALPLSAGFRGAVVLAPGTFHVSSTLKLTASGVVLRGSGSAATGSALVMTVGTPFTAITMTGAGSYETVGTTATMTDGYVPSGASSFNVSDPSGFAVGDAVRVHRPVTSAWVTFMGMNALESSGKPETWIGVGSSIDTDRAIAAISGKTITLDVPLTDSFDATYLSPPGGSVDKYTFAGRISQVGVEHLRVVGPPDDIPIADPQYSALSIDRVVDAWVSDVQVQDTQNSFTVGGAAKRLTLDSVVVSHTIAHTGDGMADFSISGTQTFVNRCASNGSGSWPILTQGQQTGPIAVLGFTSDQPSGISPHQRWATGLLADSCQFPNSPKGTPGVAYWDRGTHGSGQGWTIGWGVAWNVSSPYLLVQQPPGSQNFCVGCAGATVTTTPLGSTTTPPNGVFDSLGKPVAPGSLYLAQLCERIGPEAVAAIGY
jgi:Pectate lyase superfamily protein